MDANELRIGNLINGNLKSGQGRTVQITVTTTVLEHMINNDSSIRYDAIPLTEEWLLKFGFTEELYFGEKTFVAPQVVTLGPRIRLRYYRGALCWAPNMWMCVFPKYVHSLQNLYYALHQMELIPKS